MSKDNNSLLVKQLVEFGLSDKEANVYLSLLSLEVAGVNEIAKRAGINRSSTYVVLDSLSKKGLVEISGDKKVRQFVAAAPETLHRVAGDLAKKQEEIRKGIDSIVPELKALHKDTKHRPKVVILEGKEGLISAFEDTLGCREKLMRVSSSLDNLLGIIPADYFKKYIERRTKQGVKMIGIHPDDNINRMLVESSPGLDEPILIPKEKYSSLADLAIYDDKIGLMSPKDGGFVIYVHSQEIADVMKNIFDLAFEEAKRLNKQIPKTNRRPSTQT